MELHYPQKPNGMFILTSNQIEEIATMVLQEFMPWVLECPQRVDIEQLVADGLYLTIRNQMLGLNNAVLGMTAFEDVTGVPCLDDMYQPIEIDLQGGTIIIHSWLQGYKYRARRRFTIAHEGAHWVLHRSFHSPTNQQFQFRTQRQPYIACRSINIECKRHNLISDEDWEEWQADSLAASLLMPLAPFRQIAERLIHDSGRRFLTEGKVTRDYIEIVEEISDLFLVSKTAAEIRMKQLGLLKKEHELTFQYS